MAFVKSLYVFYEMRFCTKFFIMLYTEDFIVVCSIILFFHKLGHIWDVKLIFSTNCGDA